MKLPLALALLAVAPLPLFSQNAQTLRTESALRQIESAQQQAQKVSPKFRTTPAPSQSAPQLYPGESDDVGPQFLLQEQPVEQRRTWWEAVVDVQYFYTSNMFLTEKGNTDTGVLIPTLQAAFAPTPFEFAGGELSVRAGYRNQRWMYGLDDTSNQLNNFDFDVGTAFLGARYRFRENWTASLGLDYNRLLSHESGWKEFYTELMPSWSLERVFQISDEHILVAGYTGAQHFTHSNPAPTTNINDRLDSIFSLTWLWQVFPRVVLQPSYRFQHTHYWENSDRNDYFHTVGVSLAWLINDWASVRIFTNWEARDSNDPQIQDYEKFDTGGGLSFAIRF